MKRSIALIYRYKFKITIISICLMTLLIGSRYVHLSTSHELHDQSFESLKKYDFNENLLKDRSKFNQQNNNNYNNEPEKRRLTKEEINKINSELLNKINSGKLIDSHTINKQKNHFNNINDNTNNIYNNNPFHANNINSLNKNLDNSKFDFRKLNHNGANLNLQQNYQDRNINRNSNENQQQQQQQQANSTGDSVLRDLERIIHIDLKGAPPKPKYFEKFIPLLKEFGATGILLEYEDTFPFEGNLAEAKHGHAYTLDDVKLIKNLAKENGLKIMPLVQTYGHLEWLLKVKKFAHLREDFNYPQVITPCLEESYTVLFDMLDQVIKQHDDVETFHVGCDEVYYKLSHEKCANHPHRNDFSRAFMNHLVKIAKHVRSKLPKAKIIFWDDMMHGMDEQTLLEFKNEIDTLEIQPMMWGYMEDVANYFQPHLYEKYGHVFGKIWIATAYKGASGELATLTSIEHHYINHISWINVMRDKLSRNVVKFIGVAITGWSRYDHFLTLCDLLPQAIPSLIFNLQVMQYGQLDEQMKSAITKKLGCNGQIPWYGKVQYPITCTFPGHEVYEAILPLEQTINTYKMDMENVRKYLSPMNVEYSYLHKKRTAELMDRLNYNYMSMITFKNRFISACETMFYEDTANEWLTVYFVPYLDELYNIMVKIKNASSQTDWKPRPLPITLKQYPNNF